MRDLLNYKNVTIQSGAWEHDWEPIRSMGGPATTSGTLRHAHSNHQTEPLGPGTSAAGRNLEIRSGRVQNACTKNDPAYDNCFEYMQDANGNSAEYGPDM